MKKLISMIAILYFSLVLSSCATLPVSTYSNEQLTNRLIDVETKLAEYKRPKPQRSRSGIIYPPGYYRETPTAEEILEPMNEWYYNSLLQEHTEILKEIHRRGLNPQDYKY